MNALGITHIRKGYAAVPPLELPHADIDFKAMFADIPPHDGRAMLLRAISFSGLTEEQAMARHGCINVWQRRWSAWAALRFGCKMSLPAIARRFGRNHTTILHGIRRYMAMIEADAVSRSHVEAA